MSLIIYELNEVPKRIFDFYSEAFPNSSFNKLRYQSNLFETYTPDVGHLSPWITWPTLHRGVSNLHHEISDLGQDISSVNKDFPNVQEILSSKGIKVGVFGSLHSYPLPKNLDNYNFYVPDTFAAGDECYPSLLSHFQKFNLSMVRSNGRNVTNGIAVRDAKNFLLKAHKMGLSLKTSSRIGAQLLHESINKDRLVRRRTTQIEIAFDLYFKQLINTNPDVSFFFTNHVASSMHRYWPTLFPEDYENNKFNQSWLKKWSDEIPFTVKVANYQIGKLIKHCIKTNSELIVCSSMGQNAVNNVEPIFTQTIINNINKLLSFLKISKDDWEPRMSMSPLVVIRPRSEKVYEKIKKLKNIFINDTTIDYKKISSGEIRFDINLFNAKNIVVKDGEKEIDPNDLGIRNISLQDASGSYAYHIPEGILLHYKPKLQRNSDIWRKVSTLDFAPSLLSKFRLSYPNYMKGDNKLFI